MEKRQEASHSTKIRHHRAMKAVQRRQRVPRVQRVPGPEEEDPRIKCRDCGAFGHTARSRRCPIKCWELVLSPQPLGPNKENLDPWKTPSSHNPGLIGHAERQNKQEQWQEHQHEKTLLEKFPRQPQGRKQQSQVDVAETCVCVPCPSRPISTHINRKRSGLDHVQTSQQPVQKSHQHPMCPVVAPIQSPDLTLSSLPGYNKGQNRTVSGIPNTVFRNINHTPDLEELVGQVGESHSQVPKSSSKMHGIGHSPSPGQCPDKSKQPSLHPAAPAKGQVGKVSFRTPGKKPMQGPIHHCQNFPKKRKVGSFQAPENSTGWPGLEDIQALPSPFQSSPQVSRKMPDKGPHLDQQWPCSRAHSGSVQPCLETHHPPSSHVLGQPLRMIFTRLRNDFWCSRLLPASSAHPPGKQTPPAESSRVPVSVLHEDLQVSSFSEDSDWE
uniref:putative protein FAM90A23P n=1 Tax=Jaculus jaculus TaxID=51337 RepID=UPI001E1AF502|nr:putative protein FAM90A23P [Jaculus jaculus]